MALCAGDLVMANSTKAGATRVQIAAEYLSDDEPLELLISHKLKAPATRTSALGEGRDMWTSTLSTLIRNYGDVFLKPASSCWGQAFAVDLRQESLEVATCECPLER
jgi:hypothetical protein